MNMREILEPIRDNISSKGAYLGLILSSIFYMFSLFLPWASYKGGGHSLFESSVDGWSSFAFIPILPLLPSVFLLLFFKKATNINLIILCSAFSLLLVILINIIGRPQWQSVYNPWNVAASALDVGFWLGLISIIGIILFLLGWALHNLPPDKSTALK